MKVEYKGFTLEAKREKCMAGYDMLYCTATRISDGYELICYPEDSAETVREKIKQLKADIDDYLEHPEDWEDEEWLT
jgi:hypothetical protein